MEYISLWRSAPITTNNSILGLSYHRQLDPSYNVTVNHRHCILSTTAGHPSHWNDKTLVLFDEFVKVFTMEPFFKMLNLNCMSKVLMGKYSQSSTVVLG